MSRSKKKPIVKDKGYKEYNRRYRRVCRQLTGILKTDIRSIRYQDDFDSWSLDESYPDTRTVTNSYDVMDWQFRAWNKEQEIKFSRK